MGERLVWAVGEGTFNHDFARVHEGASALLRAGTKQVSLEVELADTEDPLRYEIVLARESDDGPCFIESETLEQPPTRERPERQLWLERRQDRGSIHEPNVRNERRELNKLGLTTAPLMTNLSALGPPAVRRMLTALKSIEVHLPFDATPLWAANATGRQSAGRRANQLMPTQRLDLFGGNLANLLFELKNGASAAHWSETLALVRLGLGDHVEDIRLLTSHVGGLALTVKYVGLDKPVPASQLSDGTLAFLAFVAMLRVGMSDRSVLVLDEPELHLHPALLARLTSYFEEHAAHFPIVVATHSARLLDSLRHPADSVRICELDAEHHRTRLRRLDAEALADWTKDYDGVGSIIAAGYQRHITAETGGA